MCDYDRGAFPKSSSAEAAEAVEAGQKARSAEVSVCGRTDAGRYGKQPCDCHRKMESYY